MPAFSPSIPELPGLWRGQDWLGAPQPVVPSGHAALDAVLPAGGWPLGALCELLLAPAARSEWALVLPALAARLGQAGGYAVLVAPPLEPFAPALQAAGLPPERLCWVRPAAGRPGDAALAAAWACEQALRCRDVRAVLAWLPQATAPVLRRLQLAAVQHRQLLWVVRPVQARLAASPAPLRLWLQAAQQALQVQVLKRRGPPVERPVALPAGPALLRQVLAAQAQRRRQMQRQLLPQAGPGAAVAPGVPMSEDFHGNAALAGMAAAAL